MGEEVKIQGDLSKFMKDYDFLCVYYVRMSRGLVTIWRKGSFGLSNFVIYNSNIGIELISLTMGIFFFLSTFMVFMRTRWLSGRAY